MGWYRHFSRCLANPSLSPFRLPSRHILTYGTQAYVAQVTFHIPLTPCGSLFSSIYVILDVLSPSCDVQHTHVYRSIWPRIASYKVDHVIMLPMDARLNYSQETLKNITIPTRPNI